MSATPSGGAAATRSHRVEFGSKAAADTFRKQHAEHVAPADDGRLKTVAFAVDTPETVLERAQSEALVEHGERTRLPGEQVALSEGERRSLDRQHRTWSWQRHGFEAMRAKGALQSQGATDWMNYYEPGEGAEGALTNFRASKGKAASTGAQAGIEGIERERDPDDPTVQRERAASVAGTRGRQCDHASDSCMMGDPEACEFLREECGLSDEEVAALADDTTELSAVTLGALKRSWGGYQGAITDAEAADTAGEAEPHLAHARQASKAINAIRREHDQEPLEFHRLAEVRSGVQALQEPTTSGEAVEVEQPDDDGVTAGQWLVEAGAAAAILVALGKVIDGMREGKTP